MRDWLKNNYIPVLSVCVLIIVAISAAFISRSSSSAADLEKMQNAVAEQNGQLAESNDRIKSLELENANRISVIEGLRRENEIAAERLEAANTAAQSAIERLRQEL